MTGDRALLALYDVVTSTETTAFAPETIARRLLDEPDDVERAAAAEVAGEIEADD